MSENLPTELEATRRDEYVIDGSRGDVQEDFGSYQAHGRR